MVRKILFLISFLISIVAFSQEKTINNVSAEPNPFSDSTVISFESKKEQGVLLTIKNVLGKTVYQDVYYATKGIRKIRFEKNELNPGMYIYTIQSDKETVSKRFVIK